MLRFGLAASRRIFYAGESVRFFFEDDQAFPPGDAFLRTNLGMAAVRRREIINEVEKNIRSAGRDWHDLRLNRVSSRRFELELMLTETGIFELKPFFVPDESPDILQWPAEENMKLKVEAAENVGANLMYTAFVRQFGRNCQQRKSDSVIASAEKELDNQNYSVIPPSGTFRDLKRKLDFIFGRLGCRILQLLPVHPVPVVYGRMGRFGSPFAALDYFAVDPALAEFDECATPMEQFEELVDAVHARKGRIFLDIPVNHTGWASRLQTEHPEWFVREQPSGRIESPGAWGVVWADLCKLDYTQTPVQRYMAEVFLYWCRKGVDGFRCDAGYMLPTAAWRYIEAKVRSEYPDTVFMLEGLGGPLDKQEELLGDCGLDWGYSELFQNYNRHDVESYSAYAAAASSAYGTLINFSETHDNNRLAATSETFARMRCALMCCMSDGGTFGFTNGVEWYAAEKIDVHGDSSLNWGSERNMIDFLQKLHGIMRLHPAFYGGAVKFLENLQPDQALAIRREHSGEKVLCLINLDWRNPSRVEFNWSFWEAAGGYDLLQGDYCQLTSCGNKLSIVLNPGECRILSKNHIWLKELENELSSSFRTPELIRQQKLDLALGKALLAAGVTINDNIKATLQDFRNNWRKSFRNRPVVEFNDQFDTGRLIMVPPGWCLAINSKYAFRAELKMQERTLRFERSVRLDEQNYFALFAPLAPEEMPECDPVLEMTVFEKDRVVRRSSHIRYLPSDDSRELINLHFDSNKLKQGPPVYALGVNDMGGYCQIPGRWGEIVSKYDALLAANINTLYPVDRRVMLSRCRVWLVLNGFSQEVKFAVQTQFRSGVRNMARWEFDVPVGQGKVVKLDITSHFATNADALELEFRRRPDNGNRRLLNDHIPVKIIIRPEIDDRDNHQITKAYTGSEHGFPNALTADEHGFCFAPVPGRSLRASMSSCRFFREDQWQYMTELPLENYYGLEHHTDSYSPGYFAGDLSGGQSMLFSAAVNEKDQPAAIFPGPDRFPVSMEIMEVARIALANFVVKRNEFRTVIAGYPWFLDWGRDTFIALRGIIASGMLDEAREIILQFAGFEKSGTIPNMIRGGNDSNRDTSDAPLWLAVALDDYIRAVGNIEILDAPVGSGKRSVLDVIESIAANYRVGTYNGIFADAESNLIYSPAHFTWMDTNYPAATPRAGYPIEIQALWYALQKMLSRYKDEYRAGCEKTAESIKRLFYLPEYKRFSDCLHASPDTPAAGAVADNALRPNQLFAVTLGAVQDEDLKQVIVESSSALVIPGAIRSLGNLPVEPPLAVKLHGQLLNDPHCPYIGHYCGPEDTQRKAAYHNGTAWCWPFPSYVEAFYMVNGDAQLPAARALLKSSTCYFNDGCPGQLPEIADGDYPHNWGGCVAQAWSVSEFFRVGKLLGL